MGEKQGWGRTVLGWFVVQDEEGGSSSGDAAPASVDEADALIKKYASTPQAEPPPIEIKGPLPRVVDGGVDLAAVYESLGVDADERDRVTKAQELLRSLPQDTPVAIKKQIVEASLKAFGVPTEKIIEAAVAEIEALESFIRAGQGETQQILSESTVRITALETEIAEVRSVMQKVVGEQEARTRLANQEKLRIQDVLEFFGQEAVARVVQKSPKLHDPNEPAR
jgi:hypothetical protein